MDGIQMEFEWNMAENFQFNLANKIVQYKPTNSSKEPKNSSNEPKKKSSNEQKIVQISEKK